MLAVRSAILTTLLRPSILDHSGAFIGHPLISLEAFRRVGWISGVTCLSTAADELKQKLVVIPLPQLSPNMSDGVVRKWLKRPREKVATYDVVLEVDTDNLSEEAYKVGDMAGTVTMLVEAQEDGFVSEILVDEGEKVSVHTPVATMCEFEEELEELEGSREEVRKLLENPGELRQMTWQSYFKDGTEKPGGCD